MREGGKSWKRTKNRVRKIKGWSFGEEKSWRKKREERKKGR